MEVLLKLQNSDKLNLFGFTLSYKEIKEIILLLKVSKQFFIVCRCRFCCIWKFTFHDKLSNCKIKLLVKLIVQQALKASITMRNSSMFIVKGSNQTTNFVYINFVFIDKLFQIKHWNCFDLKLRKIYVTRVNPRNLSSWKVKQILDLNSNCTL